MNKRTIIYVILSIVISFLIIFYTTSTGAKEAKEVYRVYLKGKSLGLISSKSELENYIDNQQKKVKEEYGVKRVYAPAELDIVKETTYEKKLVKTEDIYKKIENISPFTIDGYKINIKGLTTTTEEGKKQKGKDFILYVIDKDIFKKASENTVKSFITEEKYNSFANNNQKEITETGTVIENIYIKNKISIKKERIPIDKDIYMEETDLSKILLFGTLDEQGKYMVKAGDTIEEISFNNKISPEEFLIANPNFKDKDSLLFEGQEVTIGLIQPKFSVVEEDHTVVDQDVNYETEVKYDDSKNKSYSVVEQAGVKGKNRLTQKIQKVNGEITNVVTVSTEQLAEPIKEVIVKGGRETSYSGSGYGSIIPTKGEWGWPATCSTISSPFGYRWGYLHNGTDIAGCGYGSSIFAAQAGTVVEVTYRTQDGNFITIDHHNGYYTMYCHLAGQLVKVGQNVEKGQVIGTMGKTGYATGVHLHFAMWRGFPYKGGTALNAMMFY